MNRMRLIDADDLLVRLRGNVLVDVTPALEEAIKEQPSVFGKEKPIVDQTHEIAVMLETQANIELQKATSYHNGYIQACEDFGRALRNSIYESKEDVKGLLEEGGNNMNDGWIPVEEQLPEKGGKDIWYLVEVIGGKKPYMILNFHDEWELFGEIERDIFLGDHIRGTAYRWRPLPEPYRPERSDNHDGE